jgi:hypothetical protein
MCKMPDVRAELRSIFNGFSFLNLMLYILLAVMLQMTFYSRVIVSRRHHLNLLLIKILYVKVLDSVNFNKMTLQRWQ